VAVEPTKHLISADEYEGMVDLFPPESRLELLGGEIVEMTPIGAAHGGVVNQLTQVLSQAVGARAIVAVQNPIRLSGLSEPQPDLALLRPRRDFYKGSHPRPEDVLLVIEVADTTARWDRRVKRPLYAAGAVPEMWLVDIGGQVIEVATDPGPYDYRRIQTHGAGATLHPVHLPEIAVEVSELFG
jgi:Uma2 family endonuclease